MEKESSAKYYYRYKVNSPLDTSDETLGRRLIKMKRNYATIILFDWTDSSGLCTQPQIQTLNAYYGASFELAHLVDFKDFIGSMNLFCNSDNNCNSAVLHIVIRNADQLSELDQLLLRKDFLTAVSVHFSPLTKDDLASLKNNDIKTDFTLYDQYSWHFLSYNKNLKKSLTIYDIGHFFKLFPNLPLLTAFKNGKIKNLEIWNDQIPSHYELEPEPEKIKFWQFQTEQKNILISIIIPSFNNCKFLANTLHHLIQQDFNKHQFEIIVVEDGGHDHSYESIRLLFSSYKNKINLKFIYWTKADPHRGEQNFFRAGLARNLGVGHGTSEQLVFLDSDILVPKNFISTCWNELKTKDLIQFQRFHINQKLSYSNPLYEQVCEKNSTYIEDSHYWSQLFNCSEWEQLESYWKFTCTYALGINKSDFFLAGRFKKYYVSYGFEDTDLGYEMFLRKKTFKLIKIPLFHLTSYDQMQYKNSISRRTQLLKRTSAKFYLQHLDFEIFSVLKNYFRFEKPFVNVFKDLL